MANAKLKCKSCKNWFDSSSVVRVGLSTYCSRDCQGKDFFAIQKRKVTSSAKHKKESSPASEVVDQVLAADGYRCRVCGKGGTLILHHIHYRSEKEVGLRLHQKSNLISLHNRPCHLDVVHKDKKKYKPLLLGLVWLRECFGKNNLTADQLNERLENGRF